MSPEEIAELEGIEIVEVSDMPGRFADVYCLDTIVLPKGLPRVERQLRIAHCLGHHRLHDGNQVWLMAQGLNSWRDKQEAQAWEFALCLCAPQVRAKAEDVWQALRFLRGERE